MNIADNPSAESAIGYLNSVTKIKASADAVLQAQVNAGVVHAMLAVAVEVRGVRDLLSQQAAAPVPATPAAEVDAEELGVTEIDELAARMWEVDSQSSVRRFEDDYASTQDKYRKLALAALGLTDGPEESKR